MPSELYSRGGYVDRAQIDDVELPEATKSYNPVSYSTLIDLMVESLKVKGWEITREQHSLSNNDKRYFGVFDIIKRGKNLGPGVEMAAGLRSSLDMRISNEFLAGIRVMVCDNLQFTCDLLARGRHTKNVMDRLPSVILNAVRDLEPYVDKQREMIETLKSKKISIPNAHHQMVLLAGEGIISWGDVRRVSDTFQTENQWGKQLTLWRLCNAVTWNLKNKLEENGGSYSERTAKLTQHLLEVAA
jgi:hypothetical protein